MLPEIVEHIKIDQLTFACLSNGVLVTGFELSLCDVETAAMDSIESSLSNFLKSLNSSITARFVFKSQTSQGDQDLEHSRSKTLTQLKFVENRLQIFFEMKTGSARDFIRILFQGKTNQTSDDVLKTKAELLTASFDLSNLASHSFKTRPLEIEDLKASLIQSTTNTPSRTPLCIELGSSVVGVIRLVKLPANAVSLLTLSSLKDSLPLPYEIRVSVKRLSNEKSEIHLRRRTAQTIENQDKITAQKYADSQDQLEDVALYGGSLLYFEFLILIPRLSESDLRRDASEILQRLKPLGDFTLETFGCAQSFLSSQIGFDQHVVILESDRVLPCFLPCFTSGGSPSFEPKPKKRSLVVHRKDQSLFSFDLFNTAYDNYSVNVIGRSGRGKSVFTNLLTRALHHDQDVSIIKIDVGGSHSKETSLLRGVEKRLLLSEPSGINPFQYLSSRFEHSEDVCNVICNFLNVLLLEEGESVLSKTMRGEIEAAVYKYSLSRPEKASISDFYQYSTDLPRRNLLARWTGSGIYRNAFAEIDDERENENNRLKYFNFSQIFQANDPDFGQGGLAAVMAQFNLDMMKQKKKLVFIADETPFFIERCFSFFKFSTANVRKFGGSFITIAQKSSDLVVNGDTGIIENSSQKFVFSTDGEPESFSKRMKFDSSDMEKIESLESIKGEFSEVLFKDIFGSRVLRLLLTPEEYWSFTSSQDDNEKIRSLMENVKGLKLQEAIKCLSLVNA